MAVETHDERAATAPTALRTVGALVRAARPLQWSKNLLVFAGIIFAVELDDIGRWTESLLIFAAFCLASSASYLVNDARDAPEDRAHPIKRLRPIASGELAVGHAIAGAVVLAAAAILVAAPTGWEAVAFVAAFLALQAGYTGGLKHVVLVDALVIALLFVVRAAAGAVGIDVRLSPWLVLCSGLLALFLALGKRRAELIRVSADRTSGRRVLDGYSLGLVDQLVTIVTAATISAYSIYTFTATDSAAMMSTILFVVFGLFRYLYLVDQHAVGEEPDRVALTDLPTIATIVLWIATATVILAVS